MLAVELHGCIALAAEVHCYLHSPKRQDVAREAIGHVRNLLYNMNVPAGKSCYRPYGWNPQKPAKQDGNNTTTLSHHPYILCHFANYAHYKTLYMHFGLFTPTKSNKNRPHHCMLLMHQPICIQEVFAMLSSNKICPYMPYRLSTACALQSFCIQKKKISAMLMQYVAVVLQPLTTHSPYNISICSTHAVPFHN